MFYKACICSYCGENYAGWQRQKNAEAIQNIIEKALFRIYNENIITYGSGRTDSGVHALAQVFSFKASKYYDNKTIIRGLNSIMPKDIVVFDALDVNSSFHAGKSIISKSYEYKILNTEYQSPFLLNKVLHFKYNINKDMLNNILQKFQGTHDFASFCVKRTKKENTVRTINFISLEEHNNEITITINANGFLHNMIRIIIGTALNMIKNNIHPDKIDEILLNKNRKSAGPTISACGLYQKEAFYSSNISGLRGIPEKYLI